MKNKFLVAITSYKSSSNSGSALPADLDPRGYLANASWLQNTVQISQLARLNRSLTSLHEAVLHWLLHDPNTFRSVRSPRPLPDALVAPGLRHVAAKKMNVFMSLTAVMRLLVLASVFIPSKTQTAGTCATIETSSAAWSINNCDG